MSYDDLSACERALVDKVLLGNSTLDRRRLLISVAAFAAAGATSHGAAAQQFQALALAETPDWKKHRSPTRIRPTFVKDLSRLVDLNATNQGGQYWNFTTYITPIEDFYIRNEYPTPLPDTDKRVDPRHWRLRVHGDAVERPLELTYDDLLKLPSKSITCTMECAGNGRSLFWEQQDMLKPPQEVTGSGWGLGGIGQAEWQYVPISQILGLAGVKKNARAALFWSGVDSNKPGTESDTGRPVPFKSFQQRGDDIGLAFKMNGQDLPPDHGGPVRALIPGWCGAASTKWLTEIKIASHDFWVPLNGKRHVMIGPDYRVPKPKPGDEFRFLKPEEIRGPMVSWSPPRSLITVPLVLEKQPKFPHNYPLRPGQLPTIAAGAQILRGYAWAPQFGIKTVEVQIDAKGWQKVEFVDPIGQRYKWSRFQFHYAPEAGEHTIETRVTDWSGATQPSSVPYNQGGFNFWAVPKFKVMAV